jgi:hypothetical protein
MPTSVFELSTNSVDKSMHGHQLRASELAALPMRDPAATSPGSSCACSCRDAALRGIGLGPAAVAARRALKYSDEPWWMEQLGYEPVRGPPGVFVALRTMDGTMNAMDMLASIPGEWIGVAAQSLPEAATCSDTFREASVQLPDGRLVVITFRRLSHRHGHSRHWFWSAIRAIPVDSVVGGAAHSD